MFRSVFPLSISVLLVSQNMTASAFTLHLRSIGIISILCRVIYSILTRSSSSRLANCKEQTPGTGHSRTHSLCISTAFLPLTTHELHTWNFTPYTIFKFGLLGKFASFYFSLTFDCKEMDFVHSYLYILNFAFPPILKCTNPVTLSFQLRPLFLIFLLSSSLFFPAFLLSKNSCAKTGVLFLQQQNQHTDSRMLREATHSKLETQQNSDKRTIQQCIFSGFLGYNLVQK